MTLTSTKHTVYGRQIAFAAAFLEYALSRTAPHAHTLTFLPSTTACLTLVALPQVGHTTFTFDASIAPGLSSILLVSFAFLAF